VTTKELSVTQYPRSFMEKRIPSIKPLLLAALLCMSFIPQASAVEPVEHQAFGFEYDYSNLNADINAMSGLPMEEIIADIMQSAADSGIDLIILEENTGTSGLIIDQYQDGSEDWTSPGGESTTVDRFVTELTFRSGIVSDSAIITEWSDSFAGWDLTIAQSTENIFNIDSDYVEYRDADGLVLGFDTTLSMLVDISASLDIDGSIQGDDSEVLPLNMHTDASATYEIVSSDSIVRFDEGSSVHQQLTNLLPGQTLEWHVNNGVMDDDDWESEDDDTYWQNYPDCAWEGDSSFGDDRWTCKYDSNDTYYDDWWYLCELDAGEGQWYCTDDHGQDSGYSQSADWTYHNDGGSPDDDEEPGSEDIRINEFADTHTGDFSTAIDFSFDLNGLPSEELGFPAGDWDVSVSDDDEDSGSFDENFECEMAFMIHEDSAQTITMDDGSSLEVFEAWGSPLPMGMTCSIANLFMNTVASEDAFAYEDLMESAVEENAPDIGESDDIYAYHDGLEMSGYQSGNELELYVSNWNLENDNGEIYEVSAVMSDSSGKTVSTESFVVNDGYYYEYLYLEVDGWGNHCVEVTQHLVGGPTGDDVVMEECIDMAQQPEPSELLVAIVEGFEESGLENVIENFGKNLENRLSGYEADVPYDDGMAYLLFDTESDMVVGFHLLVSTHDSEDMFTLVGPDSDSYDTAPTPITMTYFSGVSAIAQQEAIEDNSALADLVDLSKHSVADLEEATGIDFGDQTDDTPIDDGTPNEDDTPNEDEVIAEDANSGLLPFMSPAATIAMVALAGIVATIRTRKE